MIAHVRRAANETGRSCRILMDLAGPKVRTGPIVPGPNVRKFKPQRDARGRVLHPASLILYAGEAPQQPIAHLLPIDTELATAIRPGDVLNVRDARGRKRSIDVLGATEHGLFATSRKTLYLESGQSLKLRRNGRTISRGTVGELPPQDPWIELEAGDTLILTAPDRIGMPARSDSEGRILQPASIPCTLPGVFADVARGAAIYFDDGKIGGIVEEISPDALLVRITSAREGGSKLRSDKGINLPDSSLSVPALTEQDLENLDFVAANSDRVGLSFVRSPEDVFLLHRELEKRTDRPLGIILKIETRRGFEQLPGLLLAGLLRPSLGVMVARGDLGVEVGFERMAEVQEEILWLCEAAHVPVVWATQVLEQLNKRGMASRGEITDAAMSTRAECVMLNKGPHVVESVQFLENVIQRMQDHYSKKTPMLRKLKVSEGRWREFVYADAGA
jgi:pyruvate kinase